jgi:phenylacetate-CoA ligase
VDWHARLIRTVLGPAWARWEGSPYLRDAEHLRKTQYDSSEVIRARQWRAVQEIVQHAYATVPFYRRRLEAAGVRADEGCTVEDYHRLPILSKADIRSHATELLSAEVEAAQRRRKRTSGSTGVSLEIWVDEASMQWKRACTLRSDEWSGWRFGESVARVWGNPDYLQRGWRGRLRNALLDRGTYLDTLRMDDTALQRFAHRLQRKPASLLFGHAHSVYLFAEYVRKYGVQGIRPRGIITTAMVLHGWQRQVIEEVFHCPVTNRYGCEEVSLIACECEQHQGLHVNADGVYVEIVRDGRPARAGEPGSVIVTDLTNRAMPLLRYQVGDVAVWSDRVCPCGRGLPLLERLEGREADYVVTPDGQLISGISLTENFALMVPGIAQLQIVQESIDKLQLRVVRGPEFGPPSLKRIQQLVQELFGGQVRHECEYVSRIPQEPSGKYRFCISKVPNPFTRQPEVAAR